MRKQARKTRVSCGEYREDMYQLGLILLEATNLRPPTRDIQTGIALAQDNYSPSWTKFLKDILVNDIRQCPDAATLTRVTNTPIRNRLGLNRRE